MSILLRSQTTTTELPNPELSNVEQSKSTLTLLRARTGQRYTYVKRRTRKRFLWTFQLTRQKAWEVRAFLLAYYGQRILITDWRGAVWAAVIQSNPAEFQVIGRDKIHKEILSFTLEFDATIVIPVNDVVPVEVDSLIDDEGNFLVDSGGNVLVVPVNDVVPVEVDSLIDDEDNFLVDSGGNVLIGG